MHTDVTVATLCGIMWLVTSENSQPNHETKLDNLFNALLVLVVVQVVTISSEFLAELRQLLLTPSNFLAGHCIAWRAISRVWAKGMHGCQGNKQ